MRLEPFFQAKTMLLNAVPLTIQEPGIAYLNDIHLWVITLNKNDPSFDPTQVTLQQIIELMEHHSSCYPNQLATFDKEREAIIQRMKKEDGNKTIDGFQL